MEDVIANGNQYKLKDVVIEKLEKMNNKLLQKKKADKKAINRVCDRLIDLADDIRLILHSLKINKRMMKFDQQTSKMIEEMISNLFNIDSDYWRVKAKKEKLDNFFYNLQHIDDITDFNYTAMFNMKCVVKRKQGNMEYTERCQPREIGLENVGATCYMNATLQILVQIQELYEAFNFYVREEYDNRFSNMIEFWRKEGDPYFGAGTFGQSGDMTDWSSFNKSKDDHVQRFRDLCIRRLKQIAEDRKKNNKYEKLPEQARAAEIKREEKELKLILKCFDDDQFYNELVNDFGGSDNFSNKVIYSLPKDAIDIGYEFFLVLKGIIEHASDSKKKDYYIPRRFKDLLGIVNPLFGGANANDSKDLILFLYEAWHGIYNKANNGQSSARLGGNINQTVAMNIQQQLDMIDDRLNLLDVDDAKPTLNYIENCLNSIKQCIESANTYLAADLKKHFLTEIDDIWNGIRNYQKGDSNGLDNIGNKLRQFKIYVRLNVAPSLSNEELKLFFDNYFNQNKSFLTDEFYFVQESHLRCHHCGFDKASYSILNLLIFPLAKVYKTKLQRETQKLQDEISAGLTELTNINNANMAMACQLGNMAMACQNPFPVVHDLQQRLFDCQKSIVEDMGTSGAAVVKSKNEMQQIQQQLLPYCNFMSLKQKEVYENQLQMSRILEKKATVTLKECFTDYIAHDHLTGPNQIFCNNCRKQSDATTSNKLYTMPKKMTIILNRGQGIEFDIDVEPEDYMDPWDILDLNNHMEQCFNWIETKANLLHSGPSSMSGHFTSSIKSRKDNRPRTYNDPLVSPRNGVEASFNEYGSKEMPYVLFTDTMTPHSEIDVILGKVKNDAFRDAICAKFLSLGVRDAEEKKECNKRCQQVFAYLLMYAYKKCMAYKDTIQKESCFFKDDSNKNKGFDYYLSCFIYAEFNIIVKTTIDNLDFTDNGKEQTVKLIEDLRKKILCRVKSPTYYPDKGIINIAKFDIYSENGIKSEKNNQFNNIQKNNIININQFNFNNGNNIIISNNNQSSASCIPALRCTLEFIFNENTFTETIDNVDNNSTTTIKQVFDKIVKENPNAFMSHKNFKIELKTGTENIQIDQQNLGDLIQQSINNTLTFNVSGEEVLQNNINNIGDNSIVEENYYDPNAEEDKKYRPPMNGVSKSTWLKIKIIFTVLAVMGGIAAAIFEIYWLIIILAAATVLTWVWPKLCPGGCSHLDSPYGKSTLGGNDYDELMQVPRTRLNENEYENEYEYEK